jgi:hypothetical protein
MITAEHAPQTYSVEPGNVIHGSETDTNVAIPSGAVSETTRSLYVVNLHDLLSWLLRVKLI